MNKILSKYVVLLSVVSLCVCTKTFAERPQILRLATTTSVAATGLLDRLLRPFEQEHGVKVHVVAVGTGRALELARRGDADVVMVHNKEMEEEFIREGHGLERIKLMYNDFVLLGPDRDPAGAKGLNALSAFKNIAESNTFFVSRGDQSGTNARELSLWKQAKIMPKRDRYKETGSGMAQTLIVADELGAYTLSDRATFVVFEDKMGLHIIVENDPSFLNQYTLIAVSPRTHPGTNVEKAKALIRYLVSNDCQRRIGNFRIRGQQLFFPNARQVQYEKI